MNARQRKIYEWLLALNADAKAVEFRPHEYLRKTGSLASTENIELTESDVMMMGEEGRVLIGPSTAAGHMVMLTEKAVETLLLPFERLLAMHALMSDEERAMLRQWEQAHLGSDNQLATSDWPGWRVVIKRLSH